MDDVSAHAADPEASAYRKASLRLLPLIALGYGAAYIDRVNISFASLQMNRDLHFSASIYGLGAGLFFLGYAACEIPSNLLLYRFGARRWLARIMVSWGLLAMAMALVRTPGEFYGARLALGIAEAGFFPGVVFYVSQWFPPERRARSMTRFYIAWPLSVVAMGAVAGALMNLDGRWGLSGWQWLFIVEGLPAVVLGFVFFVRLPDSPSAASWLTPAERDAVLSRQSARHAQLPSKAESVGAALRDQRVWALGLFNFCMLGSSYAYSFSAPTLVKAATGLGITGTGFVVAALYVLGACSMYANGVWADRGSDRYRYAVPGCLMMSVGFLTMSVSSNPYATVLGLAVVIIGHMSVQGPFLAIVTGFLRGRGAAAGIACVNMIGILGGFVGPYWMGIAKDLTGDYRRGLFTLVFPMLAAAGLMLYLRWHAHRTAALAGLPAATLA